MDSGLVLSSAIFYGNTLLVALSRGQGCAVIQLCVMDNAPGWNKTPKALALVFLCPPRSGVKQLGSWGLWLKGAVGRTHHE